MGFTAARRTNPAHGTVTVKQDGSFTYKPAGKYVGPDSFTYDARVLNLGVLVTDTAVVTLNVTNAAPVAHQDAYTATTGVSLHVGPSGVLANDDDADGDHLTATLVDGGGNGSLSLAGDGGFTFKSGGSFTGTVTFTYRVSDGLGASSTTTVTITVKAKAPTPHRRRLPQPRRRRPPPRSRRRSRRRPRLRLPARPLGRPPPRRRGRRQRRCRPCRCRPCRLPTRPPSAIAGRARRSDTHAQPYADRDAQPDTDPDRDRDAESDARARPRPPSPTPTAHAGRRHHPDSARPARAPRPRAPPGSTAGGPVLTPVAAPIFVVPAADDPGTIVMDAGGLSFAGFEWAVPALILTVPGLLVVLAVGAQALAGLVLLRLARRSMESDRHRPRRA